MKSKLLFPTILFLIILLGLTSSCGHKYYAPNDADLVILKEKHDVHISGTTNLGNKSIQSYNVQLGYSPIKHLCLAGSYFKFNQWKNPSKPPVRGDGKIWNASIGGYLFQPFISTGVSKRDSRRHEKILKNQNLFHPAGILMDIYVGISQGSVNNIYENGGTTRLRFNKKYIQFGIHLTNKSIGFDLATRVGKLNYYDAIVSGKPSSSTAYIINNLEARNNFNLMEHSFRANFGVKHTRFIFSVSGVSTNAKLNQLGVIEAVTSFGLILDIDEFFRNKKMKRRKKILIFDFNENVI